MNKEKIKNIAKKTLLYGIIFWFTAWIEGIAIAFFSPNGGGELHILLQIGPVDFPDFMLKIFGAYVLVGACTAFVLSLSKPAPEPWAMAYIATLIPGLKWASLTEYMAAYDASLLLIFLLAFLMIHLILAASYLGVGIRLMLSLARRKILKSA